MGKKLWMTAGYITIGLGLYMVYKSSDLEFDFDFDNHIDDDIIDVEYTIVDE